MSDNNNTTLVSDLMSKLRTNLSDDEFLLLGECIGLSSQSLDGPVYKREFKQRFDIEKNVILERRETPITKLISGFKNFLK